MKMLCYDHDREEGSMLPDCLLYIGRWRSFRSHIYYALVDMDKWEKRGKYVYRFVICLRLPLFIRGWRENFSMAATEYGRLFLGISCSRWRFDAHTYVSTPEKSITMRQRYEMGSVRQ